MTLDKSPSHERYPLNAPLVIAITGHRDPLDVETLKATFRGELERINREFKPADCLCLSSLAEGADTLAAGVAAVEGWQIIAPLPLPLDEYRKDFEGAALEEFDRLIETIPHFFVGYAPGGNAQNTAEWGDFRNRQYAHMGEFLVRHSEVLFAFWDGLDAKGAGGTGDVVTMQLQGIPANLTAMRAEGTLLDAPEGGQVVQIWTARERHTRDEASLPVGKVHGAISRDEEVVTEATRKRDHNRGETLGVGGQTAEHRRERRKEWNRFIEEIRGPEPRDPYEAIPLELAQSSPYLMKVRDLYLRADARAGALQKEVNARFTVLMWLALGFTLSVSIASAWQGSAWRVELLLVTWAFLLALRGLVWREKGDETATRYQDYRAIAEAWRIAFFWRAIGIDNALDSSYFRYQRGELDWIRQTLRTADLQWRAQWGTPAATRAAFEQTLESWVEAQTEYFKRKFPQGRQDLTTLRNWSWALLLLGLCASAVEAVAHLSADGILDNASFPSLLGNFATMFVSADLLSSPFVPAALLLSQMESWPLATAKNTGDLGADTAEEISKRKNLREWFVYQNAMWRLISVCLVLLAAIGIASLYVGQLNAAPVIPVLRLVATICFFLPALIFVYAEFKGMAENVTRYERIFSIFARARQMLNELPGDWDDSERQTQAQRIYRELGREALHENGEWLLLHRERPLDIDA